MSRSLVLGVAGAGGDGVVLAGELLLKAAAGVGYHALLTKSFGSQIRGGESSCRLRLGIEPVLHAGGSLDVAVALNWDDFLRFGAELPVTGSTTVLYDSRSGVAPGRLPLAGVQPAEVRAVPFDELSRAASGGDKAKNAVLLGLLCVWLGLPPDGVRGALRRRLQKKGETVLAGVLKAFEAGLEHAQREPLLLARTLPPPPPAREGRLLTDGNDMCAAAAVFAGCEFFSGYPITPSSEIMQYLGRELWRHGGTMLQAEDEIAGIGAVVGASFAGKKAMTATSGPGMSLKTEMLGLATIAELPLVCVNVQRGGPSTGIPTKSEQSDLLQAAFSAHGDAVRPVLAPTCVADTFDVTVEAFNIAETYQTPVIVLSDQEIAQRKETVEPIDTARFHVAERLRPDGLGGEPYRRFQLTDSGISPISQPGQPGGNYLASGIEHNESGAPTASGELHARMNDKRLRKLLPLQRRRDLFALHGDPAAPVCLVSWGSVAGAALEALHEARGEGLLVKLLVPRLLFPVAEPIYEEFFAGVRRGFVVEQSHQGQLRQLLRMFVDVPKGVRSLCKSGSNPITPEEILEQLRQAVRELQRSREPELQLQE
jgi:2-oxoglutarate ferredoxin oxidoreductase subunit alpha